MILGEQDNLTSADLKRQANQARDFCILKVECYRGRRAAYRPHSSTVAAPSRIDGLSEKALKGKLLDCLTTLDPNRYAKKDLA